MTKSHRALHLVLRLFSRIPENGANPFQACIHTSACCQVASFSTWMLLFFVLTKEMSKLKKRKTKSDHFFDITVTRKIMLMLAFYVSFYNWLNQLTKSLIYPAWTTSYLDRICLDSVERTQFASFLEIRLLSFLASSLSPLKINTRTLKLWWMIDLMYCEVICEIIKKIQTFCVFQYNHQYIQEKR